MISIKAEMPLGGPGSTRWDAEDTKRETDGLLALDVRSLHRQGFLSATPGHNSSRTVAWLNGAAVVIEVEGTSDRFPSSIDVVSSVQPRIAGPSRVIRETIRIDSTSCHFGGERVWFRCPGCDKRRAVLRSSAGRFRCTACQKLAYSSTRERALLRNVRRAHRIRRRLGATSGMAWVVPPRPRGMHQRRYDELALGVKTYGLGSVRLIVGDLESAANKLGAKAKAAGL